MKQREYPCMVIKYHSLHYFSYFYMNEVDSFIITCSSDYKPLADKVLKDSFAVKVPFYNEVQS